MDAFFSKVILLHEISVQDESKPLTPCTGKEKCKVMSEPLEPLGRSVGHTEFTPKITNLNKNKCA